MVFQKFCTVLIILLIPQLLQPAHDRWTQGRWSCRHDLCDPMGHTHQHCSAPYPHLSSWRGCSESLLSYPSSSSFTIAAEKAAFLPFDLPFFEGVSSAAGEVAVRFMMGVDVPLESRDYQLQVQQL